MTALSLLSTISTYFAFLFAFPIVCRCFLERFCVAQQIKASNPGVFCSVVGWPGQAVCIDLYIQELEEGSPYTQRKQGIVGRFMSECI